MFSSILLFCDETTEIVIKILHNRSMVNFENHLQDALNEAGQLGAQKQLEEFNTDGSPITLGNVRLTSKNEKELKVYETPWGTVRVNRFVYQSCKGGPIYCPLDQSARIIVNSTPRHAQMVS